jgi:hypothetical protein
MSDSVSRWLARSSVMPGLLVLFLIGLLIWALTAIAIGAPKQTPAALEVATTGLTGAAQAQQSVKAASGSFTPDFRKLQSRGFTPSRDLVIEIVIVTKSGFCIEARHVNDFERVYSFDSTTNRVEVSPCG